MYTLKPLPPQIEPSRLNLLAQAEPATIGHFLHTGFMDPEIRALFSQKRIAGTAITVRCPGLDGTIMHYAMGQARRGDILVIDRCGDHRHAALGGALAYAARATGIAGIIVDGMVTDIGELRQLGVPVWARGLSAITIKLLNLSGDFCCSVSCGGLTVNPGDAILADENGILVLPPSLVESSATKAIALQSEEKDILARLDAGEKYPDIFGTTAIINSHRAPE